MASGEQAGTLMAETQRLLKNRGQTTLMEIQEATGIPFFWLRKFRGGEIRDPGVNRVQRLYEYLSGQALLQPVEVLPEKY